MRNKLLRLGATALFVAVFALVCGCGGNSTPVGVTVAPNPAVVPLGGQQQFQAIVTGTSTTSVTWQLCLVPTPTNAQPTVCSPATTGQTQMPSGYGIITTGQTNTPQGGFYTAPATLPPTNDFLVVATSTVDTRIFGISVVHIDSTIRVAVSPTIATIAPGDTYTLRANVTGTTNTAVTWEVNGIAGGDVTDGFIIPGGGNGNTATYRAPLANPPGSVTITAVSGFDPAESGSASVTIITSNAPTLTSAAPNLVGEGSAQQEVFLTGTNFTSNSVVMVGTPPAPVPTLFLSTTLLHATIPASPLSVAGPVAMIVEAQNGEVSNSLGGSLALVVMPSRPAVVALSPDTVVPNGGTAGVNLIGGFFSPSTVVNCNGMTAGTRVATILTSSQQLGVTIPGTCAPAPGQYPLFVQNGDVMPPNPAMSAVNLTVEPRPSDISTGVSSSFPVGASPVGIAIDPALNLAVIANSGSNSVSIVNLGTLATSTVLVGTAPTSVAIDDQVTTAGGALGDHIAVVTNSGDNTISVIDLKTLTAAPPFALPNLNTPPNGKPVPFAIGINPLTHRGLIAFQSTNTVVIIDFSAGVPTVIQTLGGTLTPIGTGTNPKVAVDPILNWALITPGGAGVIAIVDMGRNPGVGASPADFGRSPVVIASLSISSTVQGVGINAATHQALFTDPQGPNQVPAAPSVSSFSMLDQSVSSVPFTQGGIPFTNLGLTAAAVNPLANIGIVVNGTANNGYVLDLANDLVLQTVAGLNAPQAVAVNPLTNTAYIVNQGNNTVSVFPMATTMPNPLQILETSPVTTFVQTPAAGLTLSIIGTGFVNGSQVFLDGTALPTNAVNFVSSRQLTAAIPASDLKTARRFAVYVQNGAAISNVSDLTVIQPVNVGTSPVGVAVDPYLDQAVVTNSGSNNISVVNLLDGSQITPQSPSFFATGAIPYGVGVLARTGQAVVANNGSNTITVLDEKGLNNVFNSPVNLSLCAGCTLPLGVTVDQDSGLAAVTNTIANQQICQNTSATNNGGSLATFLLEGVTSGTAATNACVDFIPLAVAIDPVLNNDPTQTIAGVTTASQANGLDLVPLPFGSITRIPMQLPTGVVFDALNGVFVVADSTANNVIYVDPLTTQTVFTASVGINPTSLDYNFNSSTLVTSNAASNTLSILAYVCPPNANGVSNCPVPRVREILDVGTVEPLVSVVVGPNSIAIDPRLNLAVQIDQANNRILLVPLPH
jgi:DNA-binding beta-propeller fold protein YncE